MRRFIWELAGGLIVMGGSWSQWLDDGTFDKEKWLNREQHKAFYAALKQTIATLEPEDAGATSDDDTARAEAQYVLENWAREVAVLYDRVGDFPLILPVHEELSPSGFATSPQAGKRSAVDDPPRSQEELALRATCGDRFSTSEAVHVALQTLMERVSRDELLLLLSKYPRASRLFISQCVEASADIETPFEMMRVQRKPNQAAMIVGKLAYGEESFVKRRQRLETMAALLQSALAADDARAKSSFNLAMTLESLALMDYQNKLENRLGIVHLVGASLIETVHKLLVLIPTQPDALLCAVDVAVEFAVSPQQLWYAFVKILSQTNQWRLLFALARAATPHPPVGFTPLAEALVSEKRWDLTPELIAIIQEPEERAEIVTLLTKHMPSDADAPMPPPQQPEEGEAAS
ncbi:hypothetical protein PINS_up022691 [Pythium insidiosum]|nr:hypothetical protein PINS_up022691 [Pythium insidiosum]